MTLEPNGEFDALIEYIRESRGFDFGGYKKATILRRLSQRCNELGITSFAAYQDHLEVHPEEFAHLFDKVLINVTAFFRDAPAWDWLAANVIPRIAAKKGSIRVWSTGAASGEEAYTLAMILCEAIGTERFLRQVKIYATDVDEEALNKARTGYTAKEVEVVDPELRKKYFELQGSRYTFKASLRRALIFGRHDLMQDAPISRLDLLMCRNTLMYFTAEAQGRILARFHYALNDDGNLFLGRAEMLLTHAALFTPLDIKQRVFSKVPRLQLRDRLMVLAQAGNHEATNQVSRQIRLRELAAEVGTDPHLVVDALGVIVLANQPARRMFNLGPADIGRPLKDLEFSYKPVDLRSPIDRVFRERKPASINAVDHALPDGTVRQFDVKVAPLVDDDGSTLGASVTFEDVTQVSLLRSELQRSKQEVETAYEELQSSNEELETTNEELQSTVEELETTNEELQSSNEELETANEELETTNSELQAINTDMRQRTQEVDLLNTFLKAITGTIQLGAMVLGRDFKINVWNEHAAELWGVRSEEVLGKSVFDLDIGLPAEELRTMLQEVSAGKPEHGELTVDAVTRRGKRIRCRVAVSLLEKGAGGGGVVILMEEMKPPAPKSKTAGAG